MNKFKWTQNEYDALCIYGTNGHSVKEICENNKFVICATDGVWEYLSNDDVMNIVKESYINGNEAEEACDLLVKNKKLLTIL